MVVTAGRAFVVSGNLDENFAPIGPGVVTVIDPATMTPIDTIESGGTNSSAAAVGPDGLVYVVNTGDFVADGSVTVDRSRRRAGGRHVRRLRRRTRQHPHRPDGLAYVSGFFTGTVVWNTETHISSATPPIPSAPG